MPVNDAIIILFDDDSPQFSLHRKTTGTPDVIAHLLTTVLAGYRRTVRRSPAELVPRLVSAEGFRHSRRWRIYSAASAINQPHAWRYELRIEPKTPIRIRVLAVSPSGLYEEKYNGDIESFLSRALRKQIKTPRGRTPRGYSSRAEYELAYTSRKASARETDPNSLPDVPWQQLVRAEQLESNLPPLPTDARIRVHTKAEALSRIRKRKPR